MGGMRFTIVLGIAMLCAPLVGLANAQGSRCTAKKMSAAGAKAAGKLRCAAKAKGAGVALDPLCGATASYRYDLVWVNAEAIGDCLAPAGDRNTVELLVDELVTDLDTMLGGGSEPSRCTGKKLAAAGKWVAGATKCAARAIGTGGAADPACDYRASYKFTRAWTTAERLGDCQTRGDQAAVAERVELFLADLSGALTSGATTSTTTPPPTTSTTSTTLVAPQCATVPAPPTTALGSTCKTVFPPSPGIACTIATPGTPYYVNAATGDDANDGLSPSRPWATLCMALAAAPSGSSVLVAAGTYTTAQITLDRPLTVKGGYDAGFTSWDPDAHPTVFAGRLSLAHDQAVFGGFRMISRPASSTWCDTMHTITAGTLVRNYIEIVYTSLSNSTQCAETISVEPVAGAAAGVACNDIYVRGESASHTLGVAAVELYALGGDASLDANRICLDDYANKWFAETVSGYGTCGNGVDVSTLTLTNNIIENAASGQAVGSFYGCGHDLNMVLTNNTIVTNGAGITGYAGESGGTVRWQLTNNIVTGIASGSGSGVQVGTSPGVVVDSASGNLVFGFSNNGISPAPVMASQNDTTGFWTPSQVLVDAAHGDFRPRSGGPAIGTGVNVFGQAAYGSVIDDLALRPRPVTGPWDRGAFAH